MVEYIDGEPVFRIVDKMVYASGRLSTASPPFDGLFDVLSPELRYGIIAAAYLGQGPHTITGHVSLLQGDLFDYSQTEPPIAGASVFAFKAAPLATGRDRFGRIPGWVYSVSGPDGRYALVVSGNPNEYSVAATHPRWDHLGS